MRKKAERERDEARDERDDLAMNALCALSEAGIPTPEKGYVAEPHCLPHDIAKLAKQRDEALRDEDSACKRANRLAQECQELRAQLAVAVGALDKISAYHFDTRNKETEVACGAGCDMGDSGSKIDERGHDVDCIFAVATTALKPLPEAAKRVNAVIEAARKLVPEMSRDQGREWFLSKELREALKALEDA